MAEAALVMAIFLPLSVIAADLATAGLRLYIGQNAAGSVAGMLAHDIDPTDSRIVDELVRADCDLAWVVEDDPLLTVGLDCAHVSISTILPGDLHVEASAVRP